MCLLSAFRQSLLPQEILIADDGSNDDTAELIRNFSKIAPVPLVHVWHEDNGFRLAEIRNKAIAVAQGDYIVQVDCDIIMEKHFIEDHCRLAKPGVFVAGKRTFLSQRKSKHIFQKKEWEPIHFWSWGVDMARRKNTIRSSWLSRCFSKWESLGTKRLLGKMGANVAFWRNDLIAINGYDENFVGYGYEDADLFRRFIRFGLQCHNLRHLAICYHLYHPPRRGEVNRKNQESYLDKQKAIHCELGIDRHLGNREHLIRQ